MSTNRPPPPNAPFTRRWVRTFAYCYPQLILGFKVFTLWCLQPTFQYSHNNAEYIEDDGFALLQGVQTLQQRIHKNHILTRLHRRVGYTRAPCQVIFDGSRFSLSCVLHNEIILVKFCAFKKRPLWPPFLFAPDCSAVFDDVTCCRCWCVTRIEQGFGRVG